MKPSGYATITDPDVPFQEWDTITCCHCNCVVLLDGKQEVGFCLRCMKPECGKTECGNVCRPFEKWLEKMEAKDRLLKQIGV